MALSTVMEWSGTHEDGNLWAIRVEQGNTVFAVYSDLCGNSLSMHFGQDGDAFWAGMEWPDGHTIEWDTPAEGLDLQGAILAAFTFAVETEGETL